MMAATGRSCWWVAGRGGTRAARSSARAPPPAAAHEAHEAEEEAAGGTAATTRQITEDITKVHINKIITRQITVAATSPFVHFLFYYLSCSSHALSTCIVQLPFLSSIPKKYIHLFLIRAKPFRSMKFGRSPTLLLLVGFLWSQLQFGAEAAGTTVFTMRNNCTYTVWATTLSRNTAVAIGAGGFELSPGANVSFLAPDGWSGRLWARTDCATSGTASLACATGDFGGAVSCSLGGAPPVTLAEFTLGGGDGKDFYDVSLVGGGRRGSPGAAPPPAMKK
nr:uncharacterized protein LOC107280997 [Oryza sativa Japonica Group]